MGFSKTMKARVSAKGWVVIPADLRRRYRLQPGTVVEFQEEGERILIIPRETNVVEELYGKLASGASLTAALLEEKKLEREREEASLRSG